jgi:hypothetical protein
MSKHPNPEENVNGCGKYPGFFYKYKCGTEF